MNLVLLGAMTFDTILAGARVIGHRQIPVIGSRAAGDAERVTQVHARATNHRISVSPVHQIESHDARVTPPCLWEIRIKGRLGATALSAFPSLVAELRGGETVLIGLLEDRSAVFGTVAQVEALGLELIEIRRVRSVAE